MSDLFRDVDICVLRRGCRHGTMVSVAQRLQGVGVLGAMRCVPYPESVDLVEAVGFPARVPYVLIPPIFDQFFI